MTARVPMRRVDVAVIRNAKTELFREGVEAALDFLVADLDALAAGTLHERSARSTALHERET